MNSLITRDGTQDAWIVEQVVDNNEYGLPDKLNHDDVIVDIGAHIGSFAAACIIRGVRPENITCYEPDPANFDLLRRNVPDVKAINSAVWSSSNQIPFKTAAACYTGCNRYGAVNIGVVDGFSKAHGINQILGFFDKIRLLKLDVEGAEFQIIVAISPANSLIIEEIVGELHYEPANAEQYLRHNLGELGFIVSIGPKTEYNTAMFRAVRKSQK